MTQLHTGRLAVAAVLALFLVVATGALTQAVAPANEYRTVALIPQPDEDFTRVQGFAAGEAYLYAIRIDRHDKLSRIYRTDRDAIPSRPQLMRNVDGPSPSSTNAWLKHANDVALVTYSDHDKAHGAFTGHMFVLTSKKKNQGSQLVELGYQGNSYWLKRAYKTRLRSVSGSIVVPTGISLVSVGGMQATFLFKRGSTVYRGSIDLRPSGSKQVALVRPFKLATHAVIAGVDRSLTKADGWRMQGFIHYDPATDTLYASALKNDDLTTSLVLVYRKVSSSSGVRQTDPDRWFKLTNDSSVTDGDRYPYTLQEIEGLGLIGGKLYFATNRNRSRDGIHVFRDYPVS